MTVLVTGGAGFIGFHLVRRLLADGHRVVSLDNLDPYYAVQLKQDRLAALERAGCDSVGLRASAGERQDHNPRGHGRACSQASARERPSAGAYRFVLQDIADHEALDALFAEEQPEIVVHLAAQAGARHSVNEPFAYAHSNMTGFLSVLEACRHHSVRHLVYASSSSVYGTDSAVPYTTQERADQPVSLYAATKRTNELMAYTYAKLYRIPTTGLRFFTVYGPWGRPDMAYFKFAERIMSGQPIQVFNGGALSRDFTYVDDVIEGVVRVMGHVPGAGGAAGRALSGPLVPGAGGAAGRALSGPLVPGAGGAAGRASSTGPAHRPAADPVPWRLFNLGRGEPVDLLEFIAILEEELGIPARREMVSMQPGDVYTTYADTLDLERAVQYKPTVSLREGIGRFVAWYREYRGVEEQC